MSEVNEERAAEGQEWTPPEGWPEEFKSPQDLLKSYQEIRPQMNRLQSQLEQERTQFSEALQTLEGMRPQEQQQQTYTPQQDPILTSYQEALDSGDARAMLAINMELQQRIVQKQMQELQTQQQARFQQANDTDREVAITLATERVSRDYPDWEELAPKVGEILQARPHWIPEQVSVEGFERALREAADLYKAQELVAEQRKQESDRQSKLQAQGLQGDAGRVMSPQEQQQEWDKIKGINLGGYSGIIGR